MRTLAISLLLAGTLLAQEIHLAGVVTRIDLVNPHSFIFIDARDENGTVANWAIQLAGVLDLAAGPGWNKLHNSLHIGDAVRVDAILSRNPGHEAIAKSVVLAKTGARLFVPATKPAPTIAGPTPRWPDGHVRLGPAPGKKGYWGASSETSLFEATGKKIPMTPEGLLADLADAGKVAPMLPWAKSVYEYRQRTQLKDDPIDRCLPPGGPRFFQTPNGFQFIEQPELGRILILGGGGDRNWKVIYTDGRPQGQADEVVRGYYGNAVGHWDKDTLIVDTIGFNEHFWISSGGLPHTEALHLIERFSRPNLNTLKYEVTIDDPRTYTRAWKASWNIAWVPDAEIEEYFCEDNAESTFIR